MIMNRFQRSWPKKRQQHKKESESKEEYCSDDDTKSDHSPMSDHADSPGLNSQDFPTDDMQRELLSGTGHDEDLFHLLIEAKSSGREEESPFMFDCYADDIDDGEDDRDDICLLSKHGEDEEEESFHCNESSEQVGLLSDLESPFERMSYDVDAIEAPTGEEIDLALLPLLAMESDPSSDVGCDLKPKQPQKEPSTWNTSSGTSSPQILVTSTTEQTSDEMLVPSEPNPQRPARSKKLYERLKKQKVLQYRKRHRYDSGRGCDLSTVTEMPSEEEQSSATSPHPRKHSSLPLSVVEFNSSPTTVVIDADGVIEEVSLDEMQEI